VERALAAIGRAPVDYSAQLNMPFDPSLAAVQAVRIILTQLFRIMEQNESGMLTDLDSEFLHDFRVAVRSGRTVLMQLREALVQVDDARLRDDFRWLGEITGPLRDLDVWLIRLDEREAALTEADRLPLQPLHKLIREARKRAYRNLLRNLGSDRYIQLKLHVESVLEDLQQKQASAPTISVKELADRRIGKLYLRVLHQGRALKGQSSAEPEAWHDLRKTCKKLRYMLNFFRSLYAPAVVKQQIKLLKKLQNQLGAIQDVQVQLQTLGEWRATLAKKQQAAATLIALDRLADEIRQSGTAGDAHFAKCFAAFASKRNHKQMQRMIGS